MQQPSLVNVPRRQESPPLSHQPLHQSHSSTVAFGTPPSSPVRQVAVLPPIAETQTEAVETNTIDEATHELVLNLTAGRIIKFESSAVTQSEQQKKVVPAKFYDGTRWLPSMAIITTRPIRQSPAVVAALGIFATTTFEGKTIQLSPRGISLFNSLRIGHEIEGSHGAKLGFYLTSVLEAFTPLEQLHQSGVAHMDLKPSNIVVTPTGTTLIDSATPPVFHALDFDNDRNFSSPTRPHESSIDGDIYSLGVTLNRIYDNFKSSGIELSPLRGLIHDMTEHSKRDRPTGHEVKARLTSIIQTVDAEGERHAIKARFFENQDGFLNTESPTFYTSADIPNQALEE
ncbi:protein kinase family protein [bacterium]|nr:protein kinase family protein [bacterium]